MGDAVPVCDGFESMSILKPMTTFNERCQTESA